MKVYICDVKDCEEEAFRHNIDTCKGYMTASGNINYKPFERPNVEKVDLCREHFIEWCKATYEILILKK